MGLGPEPDPNMRPNRGSFGSRGPMVISGQRSEQGQIERSEQGRSEQERTQQLRRSQQIQQILGSVQDRDRHVIDLTFRNPINVELIRMYVSHEITRNRMEAIYLQCIRFLTDYEYINIKIEHLEPQRTYRVRLRTFNDIFEFLVFLNDLLYDRESPTPVVTGGIPMEQDSGQRLLTEQTGSQTSSRVIFPEAFDDTTEAQRLRETQRLNTRNMIRDYQSQVTIPTLMIDIVSRQGTQQGTQQRNQQGNVSTNNMTMNPVNRNVAVVNSTVVPSEYQLPEPNNRQANRREEVGERIMAEIRYRRRQNPRADLSFVLEDPDISLFSRPEIEMMVYMATENMAGPHVR